MKPYSTLLSPLYTYGSQFLSTVLFLLLSTSIAQAGDTIKYNKVIFKVAPGNFIDNTSFRSAQVGFEFRFAPRYSVDFSYGQIFGREAIAQQTGDGFKAKAEIRRYHKNARKRAIKRNSYFAFEGFYNKADYNSIGIFNASTSPGNTYTDHYFIKKTAWGANIKFGVAVLVWKRLMIDIFGGIGLRVKDVQHLEREWPEDSLFGIHPTIDNERDRQGYYATPNLSLGIKLGYVLYR